MTYVEPLTRGTLEWVDAAPLRHGKQYIKNVFQIRVEKYSALLPDELDVIRDLALISKGYSADTQILSEDRATFSRVLLSGWAVQERMLSNGRRQIIRFLLPGDFIEAFDNLPLSRSLSVTALTPVTIADARPLLQKADLASNRSGLARAIWRMHEFEIKGLYDHVVRLGQQSAYEAVLHLFLELHRRLDEVGQVSDGSFAMPLSQDNIADCIGLSLVHVNRTVQQLRKDGLIELRRGRIKLLHVDNIKQLVDWGWE